MQFPDLDKIRCEFTTDNLSRPFRSGLARKAHQRPEAGLMVAFEETITKHVKPLEDIIASIEQAFNAIVDTPQAKLSSPRRNQKPLALVRLPNVFG